MKGRDDEMRIVCVTTKYKEKKKGMLSARLHTIKEDSGEYTPVKKYKLKRLKKIDVGERQKQFDFILHFDGVTRPLYFTAATTEQRNRFLAKLFQLAKDVGVSPKLMGLTITEMNMYGTCWLFTLVQ